ncbi:MAG: tRNA-dependent cyclodipeptide synthase [Nanoarchaeota archaeon]
MLKIINVKGGKKEDVLSRKHNIFIGISLGNKWFTKEHLKEYIGWALKNTKEKVLIWIADKIHAINYEVKNNQSPENALKRALKEGDRILIIIDEIINELLNERKKFINIARKELLENFEYKKRREFFHKKFNQDKNFKKSVLDVVKNTITLKLDELEIEKLASYVLDELPQILSSFSCNGIEYSCHPYPVNTKVSELVDKIQKKKIFPEISNEIKFKNMVFVQLE